ncbi:methyl-accepting chemotaxis protein [Metabacillus halosaccharovorans]|uniref:methyl-accepting chemotaxis protein n=1 Tax=Metabacillus halosaccharovorans TaxID=930124 RepID=UPI001C1F2FDB|nr:methyl-accepting chemotaxis protein [Metabacillus halosaccharovorans]MBU7594738.1 methyl-accepting chemotaxis protein [Metabacillus halosaccharovorans]
MLRRFNINQKLGILGVSLVILILAVSTVSYYSMQEMAKKSEVMYGANLLVVQTIGNIRTDNRAIDSYTLEYMITTDKTRNEELSSLLAERVEMARTNLQQFKEISQDITELHEEALETERLFETYLEGVLKVGELASQNINEEAYKLYVNEVAKDREVFVNYARELSKENSDRAKELNQGNQNDAKFSKGVTLGIVAIALISAILLIVTISRSLVKPIRQLQTVMKEAETGDLTVRGTYEARDEISQLNKSFNTMLVSIQDVVLRISTSGGEVAAASEQLHANSQETLKGTETVVVTMEEISMSTERQLQEVSETATVVTELSNGVEQATQNTQQVSSVVSETSKKAIDGKEAIAKTINQMESIHSKFNVLSKTIHGLGERSNEIGDIINSITMIADQTNLLALNAAIEAARAGEHGRGFAVVADEVRKLAEESSNSAMQIRGLIEKIQQETNEAVVSMESTSSEVQQGIEVVHSAGNTFGEIDNSIRNVDEKIQLVKKAMQAVETGTHKIVSAFELIQNVTETVTAGTQNVSATTEEQLASMEEISSSADSLASIAEELQVMVGKFKA